MKKQNRVLHKFTDIHNETSYINLDAVAGVEKNTHSNDPGAYNRFNEHIKTIITLDSGCQFGVREHMSEVLAYIEGRDPNPAKILYGK